MFVKGIDTQTSSHSQPSVYAEDVEPMDTSGRLYFAILYKGLERPRIWVSAGGGGYRGTTVY